MPVVVRRYVKAAPGEQRWEYDIRAILPDGTKVRERKVSQLTSRSATARFADARFAEILRTGGVVLRPPPPTFDDLWVRYVSKWCLANSNRHSTLEAKQRIFRLHISPRLGRLRLDSLTCEHIDEIKATFVNQPSTGNNVLTVVNTMLDCAVEYGLIAAKPVKVRWFKRRRPKVDFYDFHQYATLVDRARRIDPRTLAMILLGGDAALRRGEIIALEQTDVDYARGLVTIERQERRGHVGPPKGGVVATIPLTSRLLVALAGIRHLRGPRVFCTDKGKSLDESTVRRWLASAQRLANLKETGPHILRHTAISHMAMRGVDVRAIQEFARHADLKSTIGYMHLAPGHLREAIALIEAGHETEGAEMEPSVSPRASIAIK